MEQNKIYHPSLDISEYVLGDTYKFIRSNTIAGKKITKDVADLGTGVIGPDTNKGEIGPEEVGNNEKTSSTGEIGPDVPEDEKTVAGNGIIGPDGKKIVDKTGLAFRYDFGKIIGIDEKNEKIYVQFEDDVVNFTYHVFKAGTSAELFDTIDSRLQKK